MYVPTNNGPVLGQTWDMHGSACDYSVLLRIKQADDSELLIFSIAGCLGLTGFTTHHLGVCINNLSSIDAKIGVVWPAVVRKILKQQTAEAARDIVINAPLGSGHHYTIANTHHVFAIETSGTKKKITHQNPEQVRR